MERWKEGAGALDPALSGLTDAEDYFVFFDVPFDARVVHVNRLHILKKFGGLKGAIDANWPEGAGEVKRFEAYRIALERSYGTFIESSARDEKLFKVFRDASNPINVTFDLDSGNKAPAVSQVGTVSETFSPDSNKGAV